jgi:DNA-binding FadR family transcriptional regulator
MVAGVLRERIINGELGDGDLLPKQEDLMGEFRISRPALREALRILEHEGLLTVRRGSVGGSVIAVPSAETSAYTFGLVLQSRGGTLNDLAAAIKEIEPLTTSLCAKRPDRESAVVPQLRANVTDNVSALGDGPSFTALARTFHELAVGLCGNETLIVTVGALESLWSEQERQWAAKSAAADTYPEAADRQAVIDAHTAIIDAIEAGDADLAARRSARHVRHSQRYALQGAEKQVVRATDLKNRLRSLGA